MRLSLGKCLTVGWVTAFILLVGGETVMPKAMAKEYPKAIIVPPPDEAGLAELKEAGFDGVEVNLWSDKDHVPSREDASKLKTLAEKHGIRLHTVLRGWAQFNSDDVAQVKSDFDFTVATLQAAQGYGCDAILLVPGKVTDVKTPDRDKIKIEFNPETGHIQSVADGDDSEYRAFIDASNKAWEAYQKSVRELIPFAEQTGVVIAIENVWNNLFLSPDHFAAFIDSFDSKWVKAYFDVANHVVYGPPPQDWIRVLGDRIVKIHIKDYRLNPPDGKEWVGLREGSVDFPKVMEALKEIGYSGWLTIEGPCGDSRAECSRRLDTIIAGEK